MNLFDNGTPIILNKPKKTYVTIIAGSRTFDNNDLFVNTMLDLDFEISKVVCGMAEGADTMGRLYGEWANIPVIKFPAKWNIYGKKAGHIRNDEMAKYAEALILFWDGKSPGSKNMLENAKKYNLRIKEVLF